ncbi:MAG: hypothetical protein HKN13_10050 [Rhodothermales bacterium]|nr:hypothetical protein [Rhodothermales bacterium]
MDGEPLFRILCHCTICQRFNSAPFADVLVFRDKDVSLPPPNAVNFQTYKPPPNVQRGKCATCAQPAIEIFAAPVLPKLVMIPRAMLRSDAEVPSPIAHIFYDKRVSDAKDAYPKHRGFLRSQLAFLNYLRSARRTSARPEA